MKKLLTIFDSLIYYVLPPLQAVMKIKIIDSNIAKDRVNPPTYSKEMEAKHFEQLANREMERRKLIEEKAKTNVSTITIAVTLVSLLVTLINSSTSFSLFRTSWVGISSVIAFAIAFGYLLLSGLSALRVLKESYLWGIFLQHELILLDKDESERIKMQLRNIKLNEHEIAKKEANLAASYRSLFNGLLFVFIFVLLSMSMYLIRGNSPPANIHLVEKHYEEYTLVQKISTNMSYDIGNVTNNLRYRVEQIE